ncbi:alkaline phosphatase family protein, partial [Klebsiella aerogenes]
MIATASVISAAMGGLSPASAAGYNDGHSNSLNLIDTVVVIYAENRSFDNLYGSFPGADGLQGVSVAALTQLDRDNT